MITVLVFPSTVESDSAVIADVISASTNEYAYNTPIIMQAVPEYASTASANAALTPGAVYMLDDKILRVAIAAE